ncbi:MAG: cell wall metabolism sensor histidine kinase WalK [Clostridia bacterium]|nr:cell wall metabolism sensor histidine kinase WalK [Clostridia bacterium]
MLKNIQFKKVIFALFIIGIIIISAVGIYFLNSLQLIKEEIKVGQEINIQELQIKVIWIVAIALIVFAIVGLVTAIFLSKFIIYPINKLIKSAEKIATEEEKTGKKTTKGKKKNDAQDLENVLGVMTTELKEKLSEVSTQKNQIETILLHMTDGIIAFNMKGEIILINPAAKKSLSIRPEDNTFEDIFKKFELDINMEKVIYLENWTSTEQRIQVEDKYMNVFFAPFKNETDRPDGVIAVIQDITEHVKLDNMQKEFVADVSHELKTPITSIMGYADTLLEAEYDKETQAKFLNVIATEARRMAKLVTDLLTLSRYDNNNKIVQKEAFDLGDLVKKCQDKLAIEIKKKEHKVNCFVTADVPPVYADKYDIERVVLNILTNSIKYTKDGGEIKIYVGFVYNDAYIKVFDNGIGIPEEDLNRIFERFYRVDKARTREMGGTGLGLSIAKEILDKNGGSIDIKSVVGEGTEVVVRIPTKQ